MATKNPETRYRIRDTEPSGLVMYLQVLGEPSAVDGEPTFCWTHYPKQATALPREEALRLAEAAEARIVAYYQANPPRVPRPARRLVVVPTTGGQGVVR